ncbi:Pyridine nucleotide-disulfide oxidoreductase domain-containing protein 2 [Morella rubra]|uniref:Pyridine nucleotide-disulfide oxidoreductase domain-containing protein 2 n=1 Tax=Morella rubra TaxID=262757 RepID=A0A6A1VP15_9ROSI|nr:Pyridine nucleotide-disulfide oxidoreductase domain-containing protein 2 [Morella rubra]
MIYTVNLGVQSDVVKATLAADATIGSMASIHTPGSGYVLLHHVLGETDGERNIWSHVEGGMGSVSLAISNAAKEAGVHIVTNTEYAFLIQHLVPQKFLPDDFVRAVKYSDYSSGTTKVNVAVDKLPQFQSCKLNHQEVGPHHTATIHIGSESMEDIGSACQDGWNGLPSRRPVMEMTIPSSLDKTISPPGKHVVSLFTQYTPYKPSDGSWEDPIYRRTSAFLCGYRSDHRTPISGLYMCGSGSHPGGGVMGAPGRNAAHVVLHDVKKRSH